MKIQHVAVSGTMESSDIMITVDKSEGDGICIDLKSSVEKQFGDAIRKVITQTIEEMGIDSVDVKAVDKGALDCTIRARVRTAIYRACDSTAYEWGGKNDG